MFGTNAISNATAARSFSHPS